MYFIKYKLITISIVSLPFLSACNNSSGTYWVFIFRFVRDVLRYGLLKGWKQQDSYTKWLLILFILILAYKPVVNLLVFFVITSFLAFLIFYNVSLYTGWRQIYFLNIFIIWLYLRAVVILPHSKLFSEFSTKFMVSWL